MRDEIFRDAIRKTVTVRHLLFNECTRERITFFSLASGHKKEIADISSTREKNIRRKYREGKVEKFRKENKKFQPRAIRLAPSHSGKKYL